MGNVQRALTGERFRGVRAVAFTLDGSLLVTANDQGTIVLCDPIVGAVLRTFTDDTARGTSAMAISGLGTTLATVNDTGVVDLWDMRLGVVQGALTGHAMRVNALAFHRQRLATAGDDGTLRVWDGPSRQALTMMRTDTPLRCCTWSPDGRVLFAGGRGGLFGYDYYPGVGNP